MRKIDRERMGEFWDESRDIARDLLGTIALDLVDRAAMKVLQPQDHTSAPTMFADVQDFNNRPIGTLFIELRGKLRALWFKLSFVISGRFVSKQTQALSWGQRETILKDLEKFSSPHQVRRFVDKIVAMLVDSGLISAKDWHPRRS